MWSLHSYLIHHLPTCCAIHEELWDQCPISGESLLALVELVESAEHLPADIFSTFVALLSQLDATIPVEASCTLLRAIVNCRSCPSQLGPTLLGLIEPLLPSPPALHCLAAAADMYAKDPSMQSRLVQVRGQFHSNIDDGVDGCFCMVSVCSHIYRKRRIPLPPRLCLRPVPVSSGLWAWVSRLLPPSFIQRCSSWTRRTVHTTRSSSMLLSPSGTLLPKPDPLTRRTHTHTHCLRVNFCFVSVISSLSCELSSRLLSAAAFWCPSRSQQALSHSLLLLLELDANAVCNASLKFPQSQLLVQAMQAVQQVRISSIAITFVLTVTVE